MGSSVNNYLSPFISKEFTDDYEMLGMPLVISFFFMTFALLLAFSTSASMQYWAILTGALKRKKGYSMSRHCSVHNQIPVIAPNSQARFDPRKRYQSELRNRHS